MPQGDYPTKRLPEHITQSQADRFWGYVDIRGEDECWFWQGSLNKYGYGQFGLDSQRTSIRCPRLAFRLFYGGDPWPRDILHVCDVRVGKMSRQCCNPHHMRLGSRKQNNLDRHAKGRTTNGELLGRSSIQDKDIPSIIRRIKSGESLRSIGQSYGVKHAAISDIKTGRAWSHISGILYVETNHAMDISIDLAREAHTRNAQGESLRAIAKAIGLSLGTTQKIVAGTRLRDVWLEFHSR